MARYFDERGGAGGADCLGHGLRSNIQRRGHADSGQLLRRDNSTAFGSKSLAAVRDENVLISSVLFFRRGEFVGDFSVGIEKLDHRVALGINAHGEASV